MRLLPLLSIVLLTSPGCSDDEPNGPGTEAGVDASAHDGGAAADQSSPGPDLAPADVALSDDAEPDNGQGDLAHEDADLGPPPAGRFEETTSFGDNPGNLQMFTYVPGRPAATAPLVVVLHGCQIDARTFGQHSGWNELADRRGFIVLYPQQKTANNPTRCFNWFEPADQARDAGEPASIKAMIDAVRSHHSIDTQRIFVSGMSAGGAMANVLLAVYPDLFAGGAILAGVPYGCATSAFSGFSCMGGKDQAASVWASAVYAAYPAYSGHYPRVAIFHGGRDPLVDDSNMQELMEQWTAVHGIDQQADATGTAGQADTAEYHTSAGQRAVITYHIPDMGHSVPVDPGAGPDQGGEIGLAFDDVDLFAAGAAANFWSI